MKKKVERIEELKDLGLNVPRFFYLNSDEKIEEALKWAGDIVENIKDKLFNIRTYKYSEKRRVESVLCPHILFLSYPDNLKSKIKELLEEGYELMIDAEVPENGRISGNVSITRSLRLREDNLIFNFEYVSKDYKAMVRDLNTETERYCVKNFELILKKRYIREQLFKTPLRILALDLAKRSENNINAYKILRENITAEEVFNLLVLNLVSSASRFGKEKAEEFIKILFKDKKEIPAFISVILYELIDMIWLSPNMNVRIENAGIILEYTIFSVASGIMAEKQTYLLPLNNLVFWEYRSF